jgi:hypothetical protein
MMPHMLCPHTSMDVMLKTDPNSGTLGVSASDNSIRRVHTNAGGNARDQPGC